MNNDLISREALNETLDKITWYHINPHGELTEGAHDDDDALYKAEDIYKAIDNAPTVEPEKVLVANVSFDDNKLKEIVHTEVIDKIKSGELVLKDERPQGEWIEVDIKPTPFGGYTCNRKCNKCGYFTKEYRLNFCPKCGADMRKGGAE